MMFEKHEIEWTSEKIKRLWDHYSSHPAYRQQYFGFQAGKYVVREIRKYLKLSQLNKIVDFSCGTGEILAHILPLLRNKQRVYGVDVSSISVRFVHERFYGNEFFGGASVFHGNCTDFPDNTFDLLLCTEVVEHLGDSDLSSMLHEIFRVLKPGGFLVVTTPNNEDLNASKTMCPECGCVFHRWQHQRVWTFDSLQREMEKHSFVTKKIKAVAWCSTMRKILSILKPVSLNGLLYIGQKS